MRFLMMHRLDERAPEAWNPSQEFMEEMGAFIQDWIDKGILIMAEGVLPSEKGARVRKAQGSAITVTDGPFTEAKEVIGGFAVYAVASKEEALEWTRRFMALHQEHWKGWEGEVEVRQLYDPGAPPS
jgi:hypothetical protein